MGRVYKLRTVATTLMLVLILAFAFSISIAGAAGADTTYPCAYKGYAYIDDQPVPADTGIRALFGNGTVAEETTTNLWELDNNQFYLDGVVAEVGTEFSFEVWDDGAGEWLPADETAEQVMYGRVEVDLHAWSGATVTPTPTATLTPTIATPTGTPTVTPTLTVTPTPTPTPIVGTSVAIGCASAPVDGSIQTEINIATDEQKGIGSATITLTVDQAVVSVVSVEAGDLGEVTWDTVNGTTTMSVEAGDSPGPEGVVLFGTVTLSAVGSGGDCSDLDIEVTSLNDGTAGDPQPITPDEVTDCTFCIEALVTPTPTPEGGGLSGGAIAGIVIGSLLALGLITWLVMGRKK